jgi:tetratricopeptide (TPR) repeat protein
MRPRVAFALVVSFTMPAVAQAPSEVREVPHLRHVWDRAASTERARAEAVHAKVEELLMASYYQHNEESGAGQEKVSRAMQLLEDAHADQSPDVRLRFDFGHVAELRREEERAAPALESALRDAPDHPMAMRAFFELGVCLAKLGRTEAEIVAYDEYLSRQTDPPNRALALANRAEAYMTLGRQPHVTLGNLALAINDFRAALQIDPGYPQAHWGLSVALDRYGDSPGAIAEAKLAVTYDPLEQQISGPGVFFVPPYEQYWYEGLSATARAQQLDDAPSSILLWETAVAKWSAYVAVAASDDRWLQLAKAHLSSSQRQLEQTKKRAAAPSKGRRSRADDIDP